MDAARPAMNKRETALQRQRRKVRAAIAAREHIEQCRKIRRGIAARQVARPAGRQPEFARIDFVAANRIRA